MCAVNFTFCKSNSVISVKEREHFPNSTEEGIQIFGSVVKVGMVGSLLLTSDT